jgi:serine protease Do
MKIRRISQGMSFLMVCAAVFPLHAEQSINGLEDLRRLESSTEGVVSKVLPTTVALVSKENGSSGSGVVTTADGLILTAAHVIYGMEKVDVIFPNGKQCTGKVLGANLSKDLGMVKIVEEGRYPFAPMGKSRPLKAGDFVIAMGHSAGYDPARTPPVRFGRVISEGPGNFMTTDCTLIGGDSGGPVFDLQGNVVAINSNIGEDWKNNNHAGVDGFREDWDRLMAGEVWGELQMNPLANLERAGIGISLGMSIPGQGVSIAGVANGGPASKAGLKPGDVIYQMEDTRISDGRTLMMRMVKHQPGDKIQLGIYRNGETRQVDVVLDKLAKFSNPSRR